MSKNLFIRPSGTGVAHTDRKLKTVLGAAAAAGGSLLAVGCGNNQPKLEHPPAASELTHVITNQHVATQAQSDYQACAADVSAKFSHIDAGTVAMHNGAPIANQEEVRTAFNAWQDAQAHLAGTTCIEGKLSSLQVEEQHLAKDGGDSAARKDAKTTGYQLERVQEVLKTDESSAQQQVDTTYNNLVEKLKATWPADSQPVKANEQRQKAEDALKAFQGVRGTIREVSNTISLTIAFLGNEPQKPAEPTPLAKPTPTAKPVQGTDETAAAYSTRLSNWRSENSRAMTQWKADLVKQDNDYKQALRDYPDQLMAWQSNALSQYNNAAQGVRAVSTELAAANAQLPAGAIPATDIGAIQAEQQNFMDAVNNLFGNAGGYSTAADFRAKLTMMQAALDGTQPFFLWNNYRVSNTESQVKRTEGKLQGVRNAAKEVVDQAIKVTLADFQNARHTEKVDLGWMVH